ncbi:hypothetical protein [Xanthomonas translucens]|uniref:hypothetical protein n=1 Tax=Xanthomonas campestris pv. translucens TaxID=343 RepID=UPI0012D885BD|nr:hypothetical protein [Xanthomonas translucens]WLA04968.1 hypothetical protein MO329_00950 [Xanthomonas translucens]
MDARDGASVAYRRFRSAEFLRMHLQAFPSLAAITVALAFTILASIYDLGQLCIALDW